MTTILDVRDVEKYYGNKKNVTKALKGLAFN